MPRHVQLPALLEDARALPSTWRSLADVKKHVFGRGYVVGNDVGTSSCVGAASEPLLASAAVVLYDFFGERAGHKRSRGMSTSVRSSGPDDKDASRRGECHRYTAMQSSCCSVTLRRVVLAVLHTAAESVGSTDAVGHSGCVVVVHLTTKGNGLDCLSSLKTNSRTPMWFVDGVCVAEEIFQAYRAFSPKLSTHSTSDDATDGGSTLRTDASLPPSLPLNKALCAQATHMGDIWCTGTSLCGVRLMWVASSSRGRGVAYLMIERARRAVCYGFVVLAENVAFSEPTAMGSLFARRYQKRDDFLVYQY
ncbi:hypothetical protein JKF63_05906 [Porcisia hertigi]|uniref:N-acetyltransferase ESCO acetyl-transferase domain-containing protein n=1 Tax=Porcisia hertigi TaxID=2761500 RepID=A0A836IQM2_9TRYP|nr:hypothetical protein JKF63_05906 [Porcisia hertigi]